MRYSFAALGLLAAQIYLLFQGVHRWGKWQNPYGLLVVSIAIAVLYFWQLRRPAADVSLSPTAAPSSEWTPWVFAALSVLALHTLHTPLAGLFAQYGNPAQYSDVLPQLVSQYLRYAEGVTPYRPVDMGSYMPFPVYMPLHWWPIGRALALDIDVRWAGYGCMLVAAAWYGWWLGSSGHSPWTKFWGLFAPAVALGAFVRFGDVDLPLTLETVVGAYYLILGVGLLAGRVRWIGAGLVLCLLSRYTLVFWLPLLAWLAWLHWPKATNFRMWGGVGLAIVALYVLPFYVKNPSSLREGLAYHNRAAVDEWKGYGDAETSGTFETGIYFAPHMKSIFSGEMAVRVFKARVVQASVMLSLLGLFLLGYYRWFWQADPMHYALGALYVFIASFYFFGPLTYRYYWLVPLLLSTLLCVQIIQADAHRVEK